jgi:5-dehydro-4-deoxyglucarate dehydratase
MSDYSPTELAGRLPSGLLSFPVTHFTDDLGFDEDRYRTHVARMGSRPVAGLFAAGGTGEFFSLTPAEVRTVVAAAVAAAPDGVPVLAPAGHDTRTAVELARTAEQDGADGILLFPPYLTESEQDGLAAHVRAVCAATSLGVIIYNRGNARFAPGTVERLAADCPNLIGFKDGIGDLDLMARIVLSVRERVDKPFQFFNGLPTAEMTVPAYRGIGVELYSSAVFCFAPEISQAFYRAVTDGDTKRVNALLHGFYQPLVELRDKVPGYAVSLVKAAVARGGLAVGGVRPPLLDPTEEHLAELDRIIETGRRLIAE